MIKQVGPVRLGPEKMSATFEITVTIPQTKGKIGKRCQAEMRARAERFHNFVKPTMEAAFRARRRVPVISHGRKR